MPYITIPIKGDKGDGENIQYEQQRNTGFDHAAKGQTLECRKCNGKFQKLLSKAKLCKNCYRRRN